MIRLRDKRGEQLSDGAQALREVKQMLQPKRTKFRKAHKGRIKGAAKGGTSLNFGPHGLKATTPERVDSSSN